MNFKAKQKEREGISSKLKKFIKLSNKLKIQWLKMSQFSQRLTTFIC